MISILHCTDFYKTGHRQQFPKGTQSIYSNMTARDSRLPDIKEIKFFGLQYFIQEYLINQFKNTFFNLPKRYAIDIYQQRLNTALGPDAVPIDHIEELWNLQYLPIRIKALPEGTSVPIQVPFLTIENTHPNFYWLTNYIETMMSATLWGPCTSATIAHEYRKTFEQYAELTGADKNFIPWQGHDFSFRGMYGIEAAMLSGAAHLLSFTGTDTIAAIDFLETYYKVNANEELIGGSVPATEHAVMCASGDEEQTFRRLLTEVYPKDIVSVVSDTWDFWRIIGEVLPKLKDVILARDGKLVIRPDSGDPVKILTGDDNYSKGTLQGDGLIRSLWNEFGGTFTDKGYKVLNSHVGAIYGDSITLDRQKEILFRLNQQGFASSNVVLGIGSFTYQYVTRDTFGFAVKATHCIINGESRDIFKAPKTDSAKNSHRGLLAVHKGNDGLYVKQNVSREEEQGGLLRVVFENGILLRLESLAEIRNRINNSFI